MYAVGKFVVLLLVAPLGAATLGLVLAAGLRLAGWRRAASAVAAAALAWLLLWSLPVVSSALRLQVEGEYTRTLPVEQLPAADAIVVLGGAISPPGRGQPYARLGGSSDRLWHAARVHRAGRAPLVVLSGGYDAALADAPEAEAMAAFLAELGVPRAAMLLEGESRTTRENAAYTARLLKQRGLSRVLLVTSALHMRRARGLFEAQGLSVVSAAADGASPPPRDWRAFVPAADALDDSADSLKEIVARLVGA